MPILDVSRCKARVINYETAANMVEIYHYAHRVPSIVVAVGMYIDDILAGCITYGIPPVPNVQRCCGEEYRKNALELNRLFIHDWAGRNSESWLVGQSFGLLRKLYPHYHILISYADTGENHIGYIYQATNWLYTGVSPAMPTGWLIGTHEYHNKALVNMIGSWSPSKVKKAFQNATQLLGGSKHRYIYFLGSKKERKELHKLLRWPVLPYPKEGGDNNASIQCDN